MKELIQKLTAVPGPSGFEGQIRDLIRSEIEAHVSSVTVDPLGNLIAIKGKKQPGGLRIMLSAHMDEVGVIVTHVDKHGFVRFSPLGAIHPRNCLAARVTFLNGTRGLVNGDRLEELTKLHSMDQLYIDVGASSPEDSPVKIGDAGVFTEPCVVLGNRIVSKALDNRIGCALLIEVIKQIKETPHELICVFSAQEEVTIRGVTTAAYTADPDLGIAFDVTGVGDVPGAKMEVALGKGPAIKIRDAGMISDPRVVSAMRSAATRANMPSQSEILKMGSTDARVIQVTRAGVPAGCLSIPTRYIHSPSEMADLDDINNGLALLLELLRKPVELK
jgi:tetrahedral aminopeptidase